MFKLSQIPKNKVLFKYLFSSFLTIPVSLVTGFMIFRYINPYLMGIWSTLTVFETYATFLRLGVVNGMNRELPFSMGAGDTEKANKYAETTLAYTILNIIVFILIAPIVAVSFDFNGLYIAAILVSLIRIILSLYTTYLSGTFRSDDNFNKLSNIQFTITLVKLLFCPLVIFGFNGFLAYQLLIVFSNFFLLHYFRPLRLKPKFHKSEFFHLVKTGLPLFFKSYAINFIETIPCLYLIKFSDEDHMGIYAPIIMLLSTVSILPNTLMSYMYPKFSYKLGQTNDIKDIWQKLLKLYLISFIFITGLVIVIYFFIDYFVVVFPKYTDSLPYLKTALLICPFVFFKMGNFINEVLKKYNYMIGFALAYAIIQVASLYVISQYLTDILDVVIYSQVATAISVLLISLLLNYKLVMGFKKPQVA